MRPPYSSSLVTLTSPSIWICLTGESRVPPDDTTAVAAAGAVDEVDVEVVDVEVVAEVESLREAMTVAERHHAKRGKSVADGRFR